MHYQLEPDGIVSVQMSSPIEAKACVQVNLGGSPVCRHWYNILGCYFRKLMSGRFFAGSQIEASIPANRLRYKQSSSKRFEKGEEQDTYESFGSWLLSNEWTFYKDIYRKITAMWAARHVLFPVGSETDELARSNGLALYILGYLRRRHTTDRYLITRCGFLYVSKFLPMRSKFGSYQNSCTLILYTHSMTKVTSALSGSLQGTSQLYPDFILAAGHWGSWRK